MSTKGPTSEPEMPDTISDCFSLSTVLQSATLETCLPGAPYSRLLPPLEALSSAGIILNATNKPFPRCARPRQITFIHYVEIYHLSRGLYTM